jgi:hypothetical protein
MAVRDRPGHLTGDAQCRETVRSRLPNQSLETGQETLAGEAIAVPVDRLSIDRYESAPSDHGVDLDTILRHSRQDAAAHVFPCDEQTAFAPVEAQVQVRGDHPLLVRRIAINEARMIVHVKHGQRGDGVAR